MNDDQYDNDDDGDDADYVSIACSPLSIEVDM